ncbi:hypothetical protein EON67_07540 [archaeon]|nr:MAG: hypothetical protein EON67_07540 [archaeon]
MQMAVRPFTHVGSARKVAIMTRVMQLLYSVLSKRIHVTKRDLFYTDVKLFVDQTESDAVLDDVAVMLGCTRTSLHVVASDKGVSARARAPTHAYIRARDKKQSTRRRTVLPCCEWPCNRPCLPPSLPATALDAGIVVGRVQFKDDGDEIDCTRMGIGGKAIPPFIDRITDIRVGCSFCTRPRPRCGPTTMLAPHACTHAHDRVAACMPCSLMPSSSCWWKRRRLSCASRRTASTTSTRASSSLPRGSLM